MEYADTSFLLSYYLPDANHTAAAAHVRTWKRPPGLPLTPFGAYEFSNSLRRLVHKGLLQPADVASIVKTLRADAQSGIFADSPLEAWRWMDEANQISRKVTPAMGTRALDILHVAQARMRGATLFLSFDKNQRKAASDSGMAVGP